MRRLGALLLWPSLALADNGLRLDLQAGASWQKNPPTLTRASSVVFTPLPTVQERVLPFYPEDEGQARSVGSGVTLSGETLNTPRW